MEDTSDYYRDVVAEKYKAMKKRTSDALLLIEVRLDFTKWIPEGFGTADAVIVGDGEIDVIDYKHGKGVKVDAFKNTQMMTYAIGACEEFSFDYAFSKVTMTIVQPRIDNTSSWEIPYDSLMTWGENVLTPKAKEAYNGVLGCSTVTEVGEWCRFCKARQICKARADAAVGLLNYGNPRLLSSEDVAKLLPLVAAVKSWSEDIESHALATMLGGEEIEGYKVVEGRSTRKITKPLELAKRMCEKGVDPDALYKPKELRALTDLERLVGKAKFAELSEGFVEKAKGKPTIALSSDKRKTYSSVESDFADLANIKD